MFAVAAAEPAPMMEMNTTPLIDVMLVLLVMLIITIPPQHHAVTIDLPVGRPLVERVDRVKNHLVVTAAGATLWNGAAVSRTELRALLGASAALDPAPELHFQPEARARYALVDEVLVLTKQAGVTRMGFVGNDAYARAF